MKLLNGQQSLFGEPAIVRCQRCGRLLKGERACKRGIGQACRTKEIEEGGAVLSIKSYPRIMDLGEG